MHSLLALAMGNHGAALWTFVVADALTLLSTPSVLQRRRGRPISALAWLLALYGLPFVGVMLWWLLARTRFERPLLERAAVIERVCKSCPPVSETPRELPERLRSVTPFALAGARMTDGVFPPAGIEGARLMSGSELFTAVERAVSEACREVRVQMYIWRDDPTGRRLADALASKAREGVRVRVLVDALGSGAFRLGRLLRRAGVEVGTFHPFRLARLPIFQLRNHRKLFWFDGRTAFVGGVNVGEEYEREWHDLGIWLEGPVVHHLGEVFREDWAFATGADIAVDPPKERSADVSAELAVVIAGGPDRNHLRVEDAITLACGAAQSRIWVLTPYFIPTEPVRSALRLAALRGVDVRIVVPARSDLRLLSLAARPFFRELLEDGVRVLQYRERISHAKAMLVDDDLTLFGSANMDARSLRLNFELLVCTLSKPLAAQLDEELSRTMNNSQALDQHALRASSRWNLLSESVAHLLSPLL